MPGLVLEPSFIARCARRAAAAGQDALVAIQPLRPGARGHVDRMDDVVVPQGAWPARRKAITV